MIAKEKKYYLTCFIPKLIRCNAGESLDLLLDYYTRMLINKAKEDKYRKNKTEKVSNIIMRESDSYSPHVSKDNKDFELEDKYFTALNKFKGSVNLTSLRDKCDDFANLVEDMVESLVPGGSKEIPVGIESRIRNYFKYIYNIEWSRLKMGYKNEPNDYCESNIVQFMAKLVKELLDFSDDAVKKNELGRYFKRCLRCNNILGMTKSNKKYCDNSCQTSAASRRQNNRLRGL